jgi:hypothetical protein
MRQRVSTAVLGAAAALLSLLAPVRAGATLVGQTVTVTLTDGATLDAMDSVLVGPGPEITPGDGSQIGTLLLPTEQIDIQDQALVLDLEEGAPGGLTGYPAGSAYVFSNLVSNVPTRIVGVTVTPTNITNLTSADVGFTDDSVTVPLDQLVIGEIPGVNTGSLSIAIQFQVVPEPAISVLLLGAFTTLAAGSLIRSPRRG